MPKKVGIGTLNGGARGAISLPSYAPGMRLRPKSLLGAAIGAVLASTASGQDRSASMLEEVVVTATRREVSALEIPLNISVASGDDLSNMQVRDVTGIAAHVPGLIATDQGVRANGTNSSFIIRGINASNAGLGSFQNLISASVSTYVDETPMFANLRLTDIERVEVLRGPQGTLYGAGSVGGTIRLIQKAPDTHATEFRVTAEGGKVQQSDNLDYRTDVIANLPVNDRFAVRVSAGYEKLAGFIDATNSVVVDGNRLPVLANPADPVGSPYLTQRVKDVDSSRTWFARTSGLFEFNDHARLTVAYQHQDEKSNGFSAEQLNHDYTMGRRISDEPSHRKLDLVSATATVDLGFATLTSASGYFEQDEKSVQDSSMFPIIFAQYYGYYPRITSPTFNEFRVKSFTQEFRLVSQGKGPLHWTVGAYYQDYKTRANSLQTLPGIADWSELPGTGFGPFATFGDVQEYFGLLRPSQIQPKDMVYTFNRKVGFKDKALFGELTYDLTDAWSATAGVRAFWQRNSQDLLAEIPYFGPVVAADGNIFGRNHDFSKASFNDQVFKFNTSYRVSPRMLAYATVAEGFRAGGANSYPVGGCPFCDPPDFLTYKPDTATNYEIGIKGKLSDRFQYSAGLYRINWKNIQLETASASTNPIVVNGGKARSQGVELELWWIPVDHMKLTAGYSYTDAKLTEDVLLPVGGQLAPGAGFKGDRLPAVSKHQFSGTAEYRWPLADSRAWVLHLDGSYRSDFSNRISSKNASYRLFDGFWLFNASLGLELNKNLQVMLYGRNLANEKAIASDVNPKFQGNSGSTPPEYAFEFVQRPRTVGLRVVWQY